MHTLTSAIKSSNDTHPLDVTRTDPFATPVELQIPADHLQDSSLQSREWVPQDVQPQPNEDLYPLNLQTLEQPEQLTQQELSEIVDHSLIFNQQLESMERFNETVTPENVQAPEESTHNSILSRKVSDRVNMSNSIDESRDISSSSLHALGQFDASYVNDQIAVMERFKNALDESASMSSNDSQPRHAMPQVSSLQNWSDARDDSRIIFRPDEPTHFIPTNSIDQVEQTAIGNGHESSESVPTNSFSVPGDLDPFESMDIIPVREILPSQIGNGFVSEKVDAMENKSQSIPGVRSRAVEEHNSFESSSAVPPILFGQQSVSTEQSRNSVDLQNESIFIRANSVADKVSAFESREASFAAKPEGSVADRLGAFESRAPQVPESKSNHSSPSNSNRVADKVSIFESSEAFPLVSPKVSSHDKASPCSSIGSDQNGGLPTIDESHAIQDEQVVSSSRSHMDNYLTLKLASIDRAIKGRENPDEIVSGTSQSSQSRQYGLLDTTYVNQQIAAMERLNSALVNQLSKAEGMNSHPHVPEEEDETVMRSSTDVLVDPDQPEIIEKFIGFPGLETFSPVGDDVGSDSKSIPLEPASNSSLDVLPAVSCSDFQDKSSSSLTVDSNTNHEIITMDEQSQLNPVSLSSKIDIFESLGSGSYNLDAGAKSTPVPSNVNVEMDTRSAFTPAIEEDIYHQYEDENPPYSRDSVTPVYLDPFSAEEPSMLANKIAIFIPEMKTVHSAEASNGDSSKLPLPPAIIESDTRYLAENLSAKSICDADKFADPEEDICNEQSDLNTVMDVDQAGTSRFETDAHQEQTSSTSSDIVNMGNISAPVGHEVPNDDTVDLIPSRQSPEQADSGFNSPKDAKSERTSSSMSSRVPVPLPEFMNRKHKPDEAPPPSPTNSDEDPMDIDLHADVPTLDSIQIAKDSSPAKTAPEPAVDSIEAVSPSVSHDIFPKFKGPRVSQDLKSNSRGTPWRRSASRGVLPVRKGRHSIDFAREDSVLSDALPADFTFAEAEETEGDDTTEVSSEDSRSFAITTTSVDSAVGRILRAYRFLELRGPRKTHLCGEIDLFYSARANPGWEVTYNLVTSLVSNLLLDKASGEALHKSGIFDPPEREEICKRIEKAWRRGYNPEGAEKHGRRLVGKCAYIGTPEITAFLVSVGVGARERAFDTDNSWSRRAFFVWVYSHFQTACSDAGGCAMHTGRKLGRKRSDGAVIPPLLVQWSGHVVLVVGAERSRKGEICLIVLEPTADFIDKLKYRSVKARMGASRRAENHPTWAESNEFHVIYIDKNEHDPVTTTTKVDEITPVRTSSTGGSVERRMSNRKSNGSSLSMSFGWFRRTQNRIE